MIRSARWWHLLALFVYAGVALWVGVLSTERQKPTQEAMTPLYEAQTAYDQARQIEEKVQRQELQRLLERMLDEKKREARGTVTTIEGIPTPAVAPAPPPPSSAPLPSPSPSPYPMPPVLLPDAPRETKTVRLALTGEFFRNERSAEMAASQIVDQLAAQGINVALTITPIHEKALAQPSGTPPAIARSQPPAVEMAPPRQPETRQASAGAERPPTAPSVSPLEKEPVSEAALAPSSALPALRPASLPSEPLHAVCDSPAQAYRLTVQYRIHVGETEDPEVARRWLAVLEADGFPVQVRETRYRNEAARVLWLGPFVQWESAENWRRKLEATGNQGRILKEYCFEASSPNGELYAVQVGALRGRAGIEREASRWRAWGFPVGISRTRSRVPAFWQVHIGPFVVREEADQLHRQLQQVHVPSFVTLWQEVGSDAAEPARVAGG